MPVGLWHVYTTSDCISTAAKHLKKWKNGVRVSLFERDWDHPGASSWHEALHRHGNLAAITTLPSVQIAKANDTQGVEKGSEVLGFESTIAGIRRRILVRRGLEQRQQ